LSTPQKKNEKLKITNRKKSENQKRKKKYIACGGLILFYHRGKGPVGGTLAIVCFF